jgi:RNA polymerase sigma-70 factor (ECF subfamily)
MDQSAISKETVSAFINGSEKAFTQIYWAYFPSALLLGRRLFHDQDLAKDFVQDLFARVWEKREKFKDVQDVNAYIYGMAWKLAADRQSTATNRSRLMQQYLLEGRQSTSAELEFQYTDQEYKEMYDRALVSTHPRGQQIFKLREQGLSRTQIAERLNLAQHIVDNDLSSALKAIRTYVKGHVISIIIVITVGCLFL